MTPHIGFTGTRKGMTVRQQERWIDVWTAEFRQYVEGK